MARPRLARQRQLQQRRRPGGGGPLRRPAGGECALRGVAVVWLTIPSVHQSSVLEAGQFSDSLACLLQLCADLAANGGSLIISRPAPAADDSAAESNATTPATAQSLEFWVRGSGGRLPAVELRIIARVGGGLFCMKRMLSTMLLLLLLLLLLQGRLLRLLTVAAPGYRACAQGWTECRLHSLLLSDLQATAGPAGDRGAGPDWSHFAVDLRAFCGARRGALAPPTVLPREEPIALPVGGVRFISTEGQEAQRVCFDGVQLLSAGAGAS